MWSHFLRAFSRGHFATLTGRSTRREFWSFLFVYILISIALNGVGYFFFSGPALVYMLVVYLSLAWALVTVIPMITMSVRRFRDAGVSPWWFGVLIALQMIEQIWLRYSQAEWEVIVATIISLLTTVAWLWILLRPSQAYITERR